MIVREKRVREKRVIVLPSKHSAKFYAQGRFFQLSSIVTRISGAACSQMGAVVLDGETRRQDVSICLPGRTKP
jgi:hypothetical protein